MTHIKENLTDPVTISYPYPTALNRIRAFFKLLSRLTLEKKEISVAKNSVLFLCESAKHTVVTFLVFILATNYPVKNAEI